MCENVASGVKALLVGDETREALNKYLFSQVQLLAPATCSFFRFGIFASLTV